MKFNAIGSLMLSPALAVAQMSTGAGTNMVLDVGTSLRVNAPVIWQIPAGAGVVNHGGIVLGADAELDESSGAAITGQGTERIQLPLTAPTAALDAGGLGGILTTGTAPGLTTFIRGHVPYTDYSGHTSIARWIHVTPTINDGLNATFSLRYDPAELNAVPEAAQIMHIRAQDDIWWMLASSVNTTARTVTSNGLDSLGLFTTFDQDLPNAVEHPAVHDTFVVGITADGSPWVHVPAEEQVTLLELFDPAGRLIGMSTTRLGTGWNLIPLSVQAHGIHLLRLNGSLTYRLAWP
jgi:hypothetical protein